MADSLLARVVDRFTAAATALATGWMSPGTPLPAVTPAGVEARRWDYPVGLNLRQTPRVGERLGFPSLRALADNCTLIRLAIETRKDQLARLSWSLQLRDAEARKAAAGARQADLEAIATALQVPDRRLQWAWWLRALLEDLFVLDAVAVHVQRTRGGDPFALRLLDAATIIPRIDALGESPLEGVAYQQILKGVPAVDFTRDELVYVQTRPRTHKLFGFGPVEQVWLIGNLCIRRELGKLEYYTEGTVPEAIIAMPKDWGRDQIRLFQEWWDALFEGNQAQKRKARFIPGGEGMQAWWPKEAALKDEMDEWLARVVSFAFSLPPTWAAKLMNRATAEQMQDAALEEGQLPVMQDVSLIVGELLRVGWMRPDVEHTWEEPRKSDPLKQAQVAEIYLRQGVVAVDEVREDIGREAIGVPLPMVTTPTGLVPVTTVASAGGEGAETESDAGAAMIGEQAPPPVASLLEVVTAVSDGTLTPEAAVAVLHVAFPGIDDGEARQIVAGAIEAPEPDAQPGPGAPGGGPGGGDDEPADPAAAADGEDDAEPGLAQLRTRRAPRRPRLHASRSLASPGRLAGSAPGPRSPRSSGGPPSGGSRAPWAAY